MIALHPSLSGLPLAAIILLVFIEVSACIPRFRSWRGAYAALAVVCCCVAVSASFLSGYQASAALGDLTPEVEALIGKHHAIGRFLLINSFLLAVFFVLARAASHGRAVMRALYYLTVILHVALTCWAGALGGGLVFDHGIGVAAH